LEKKRGKRKRTEKGWKRTAIKKTKKKKKERGKMR
jgi:hypothetical protein